jgi:alpha-L-rhamnosidase
MVLLPACSEKQPVNLFFQRAEAVWPAGRTLEKNLTVGFRAEFKKPSDGKAVLNITGSTLYRIFLNGEFVGHGPARAGHGWYRVDNWDLSKNLVPGKNTIAIEVAGYNVNSYYLLDQPSFLQAEVVAGGRVLAATDAGGSGFEAFELAGRMQKVPRYSFQRPFTEVYALDAGYDGWRSGQEGRRAGKPAPDLIRGQKESVKNGDESKEISLQLERVGVKNLIERRIPYPDFAVRKPLAEVAHGEFKSGIKRDKYWKDRAVVNIGEMLGGFLEKDLVLNPAIELQETQNETLVQETFSGNEGRTDRLAAGHFRIHDFGTNLTGFIGAKLEVKKAGRFYITFDEILTKEDVDFKRLGCISAVTYDLQPGSYTLESFEPYTMRYTKIMALDGECAVNEIYLREYVNPDIKRAMFESSDPQLNRIFTAGVETFRQNAVDIFMDCPHRERAGWLCDSYFTARVASDVSGNTLVEKTFLENFLLPDSFAHLPEGMLPMCYPSDHNDSVFIPNWAMWFVVELKEYLGRSNDRKLVDDLKPKVMALLKYFEPFKNSDGLLEKLESWIFVEWSEANNFVQDVNYPTNMLYAATLDAAGEMYGVDSLRTEAAGIREIIRRQSWNGSFFVDNALRNNGNLLISNNTSEVCQYFAFYFGVATPDTYPELWKKLATRFGPGRKDNNPYPKVFFANSFVGNYLRLELLARYNLRSQILAESIGYFDYMAVQTGTLWENISAYASCDHGFASHVVHVFYRDVLGIANVDAVQKKVTFRFSDLELASCKGTMPVGDGLVKLEWTREGNTITWHGEMPEGFSIEVENDPKLILVKR